MSRAAIARRNPRFVITVTTTAVAGQLPAVGQVQREQGEQHVAVDHRAPVVHGDQPVGVAVEGEAEVGPAFDDRARPGRRGWSSRSRR